MSQNPIVGENLVASIKGVLGDAVTQPVLDAWKTAHEQLATIVVDLKKTCSRKSKELLAGGYVGAPPKFMRSMR